MDSGFKVDYEKLLSASDTVGNVLDVLQSAIQQADGMIGSIPSDCSYSDIIYDVKADLLSEGRKISEVNVKIVSTLIQINGLDDIFSTEGIDLSSMSDEEFEKLMDQMQAIVETYSNMYDYYKDLYNNNNYGIMGERNQEIEDKYKALEEQMNLIADFTDRLFEGKLTEKDKKMLSELEISETAVKNNINDENYYNAIRAYLYNDEIKEYMDQRDEEYYNWQVQEATKNEFTSYADYENFLETTQLMMLYSKQLKQQSQTTHDMLPYRRIYGSDEYQSFSQSTAELTKEEIGNSMTDFDHYSYSEYLEYMKKSKKTDVLSPLDWTQAMYKLGKTEGQIELGAGEIIQDGRKQIDYLQEASKSNSNLTKMYNYIFYNELKKSGNSEKAIEEANKYLDSSRLYVNEIVAKDHANEYLTSGNVNAATLIEKGLGNGLNGYFESVAAWIKKDDIQTVNELESQYILNGLMDTKTKKKMGLIDNRGRSLKEEIGIDYSNDYSGLLSLNKHIYGISSGIGQMLPTIALGSLNPYLGTASLALSSGGSAYHDALVEGEDGITSLVYGIVMGCTEAATEKLFGGLPFLSNVEVKNLKTYVDAMTSEGLQEIGQEGISIAIERTLFNKKITFEELVQRLGQAGAYGFITSGVLNGTGLVIKTAAGVAVNAANFYEQYKKVAVKSEETLGEKLYRNGDLARQGIIPNDILKKNNIKLSGGDKIVYRASSDRYFRIGADGYVTQLPNELFTDDGLHNANVRLVRDDVHGVWRDQITGMETAISPNCNWNELKDHAINGQKKQGNPSGLHESQSLVTQVESGKIFVHYNGVKYTNKSGGEFVSKPGNVSLVEVSRAQINPSDGSLILTKSDSSTVVIPVNKDGLLNVEWGYTSKISGMKESTFFPHTWSETDIQNFVNNFLMDPNTRPDHFASMTDKQHRTSYSATYHPVYVDPNTNKSFVAEVQVRYGQLRDGTVRTIGNAQIESIYPLNSEAIRDVLPNTYR